VALALAGAQAAWPLAKYLRAHAKERTTYTIKVPGADDIYDDLHEWVLSLLPAKEQRALVAWSSKRSPGELVASADNRQPSPTALRLRYDGTRVQTVTIAGHKIKVAVAEGGSGGDENSRQWKPPEIVFTASSLVARQALLAELEGVLRRTHEAKRTPAFRMLSSWGHWERLDDLPARDLDSVVLPPGQLERLTGDVARFLAAEAEYNRRCIPWHRGHLYEGPPGTGKTSVARAIATHFGMDVWYLPLADVRRDGDLLRMVTSISPRSMLLLEDIDVFHAATQRDDNAEVTLSGLLNALDGIATPHGLLTVMTTNTPEVLDHAVARAGRVDLVEHFAHADSAQAARLIARYYGCPPPDTTGIGGVAPADVIEACKRHSTPGAALADLATRAPLPISN